jgi:GNAT superfamily N-acetyltransferase
VTEIADAWWCRDFACPPDGLRPTNTHVQVHAGDLTGKPGIWILLVGQFPLVSLPPAYAGLLDPRAKNWTQGTVMDAVALMNELHGVPVERIIGPAFIGYTTVTSFIPSSLPTARALTSTDGQSVDALRASCTPQEWEHGGSTLGDMPTFGAFNESGELAALAGYKVWGGTIAHLFVVSRPDARGRGYATAAVTATTHAAFQHGLLPQYRTLVSNAPSMRIASKLGFQQYGYSVYVRMQE